MQTVLLALMMMLVVAAVIVGVIVSVAAWSLNKRNRLAPDIETGAPLRWIWSPTQPARLHRRLQGAVAPIHEPAKPRSRSRAVGVPHDPAFGPASTLDDVCRALTGQATAIDRDVVYAARMPRRVRRARVRILQAEVAEIERLTVRVRHHRAVQTQPASISGEPPRTRGDALENIGGHLDALADAHAELHAIERANGLDDPERILRSIEAGPLAAPAPRQQGPRQPVPSPAPLPWRSAAPPASTRRAAARRAAR